jgi:hypothetical protein
VGFYGAAYKVDSVILKLGPYEYLEYKYKLEKDASMLFSWTATAALKHDFHGDPGTGKDAEKSYDNKDRLAGNGALVAPFAGMHGWFWENTSAETVTITLNTSGFFSSAMESRSDRTRRAHELTSVTASPKPQSTSQE